MDDLEELFKYIIDQHRSIDVADMEFHKMIAEDQALRDQYRQWCHEVGNTERNGFRDYCNEYIENQESVWDSLTDYDNE